MRTLLALLLLLPACTVGDPEDEAIDPTSGVSIVQSGLTNCHGRASASIPSDATYVITTFGGGGDTQPMSCGGRADGTWYYAASRQRYGCGSRVEIRANGKCVVAQTDDYGPDVCVENAAGRPIMDVSPAVARALFGTSGFGWSDHQTVTVEEVSVSTPLGPCAASPPPPAEEETVCFSSTLDREVAEDTCVQAASDGAWYRCRSGAWGARGTASCVASFAWCSSATLGRNVPPRTCVQARSDNQWYQCNGSSWKQPVDLATSTGPLGSCSTSHPL